MDWSVASLLPSLLQLLITILSLAACAAPVRERGQVDAVLKSKGVHERGCASTGSTTRNTADAWVSESEKPSSATKSHTTQEKNERRVYLVRDLDESIDSVPIRTPAPPRKWYTQQKSSESTTEGEYPSQDNTLDNVPSLSESDYTVSTGSASATETLSNVPSLSTDNDISVWEDEVTERTQRSTPKQQDTRTALPIETAA